MVDFFGSSRGLRKGDLLSPMLFLIMMEIFSRMLKRVEGAGLLCGFKANGWRGGGECVSHLLFVDDTILFCDVDVVQILHPSCSAVVTLFSNYDRFEGQCAED